MDVQRLQVLLVAESEDDLRSVRDELAATGAAIDLHVTPDAPEASRFLRQEGIYEGAARPDLVLLDVDIPDDGARDVLSLVSDSEELEHLQIVAILGQDPDAGLETIEGHRIHETLRRPIEGDTLRRAIAFFSEI
jgi:CheY-like chemotaxis protein